MLFKFLTVKDEQDNLRFLKDNIKSQINFDEERLTVLFNDPLRTYPTFEEATLLSKELNIPLHSDYTFYWKLISGNAVYILIKWLQKGKIKTDENGIKKIILPYYLNNEDHIRGKRILEELGASHKVIAKENVILERKEANIFSFCFNFTNQKELEAINLENENPEKKNGLEAISSICSVPIRDKAGTFIGARMGRPEKGKMRSLIGKPQVMFPVGEEGDRFKSFQSAMKAGKINSTFPTFYCLKCKTNTIYRCCETCGEKTEQRYYCRFCGDLDKEECRHGKANTYKTMDLDIKHYFDKAKEILGEKLHPDLIKGVKGTSNKDHLVEHLSKGILRAKHGIYVNKDGTTRYDATELPLTHFKPKEIRTSIEKLKKLGYEKDIHGEELVEGNQILELKPQDLVLPGFDSLEDSAANVLLNVSHFVDELLIKLYKLKPYFNAKTPDDLVGQLVIGLAPHISAGIIGRIIGYSETQTLLAHPMYHAAMRRDCDGDEACVMLLMDALLNFSRQYLPERRGAKTMDAPLVLTSTIYPSEVDDQVLDMDTAWKYPLEFYEATLEMKKPWEVKVEQLSKRLGTPQQYEGFGFTHDTNNFNRGGLCSAYKTLPTMEDKLFGQMELAQRIRAVDMDDVAKLVIQKHFLKDIKGNLRKFSMQTFRCVKCNTKYRRPPLSGNCTACPNGKLIFTISEGSVVKYLGHSLRLSQEYDFSLYLKQTIQILQMDVNNVFGKVKEKQAGLGDFIG